MDKIRERPICQWCKRKMEESGTGFMCRLCDLYPHITEELSKTKRSILAKQASLELEKIQRGKGR